MEENPDDSTILDCMEQGGGEYICICDGDDYWIDDNKLQFQFDVLEKNPEASLCITDTLIKGQEKERPQGLPPKFKIFGPRELKKRIYMGHISSWMMRNRMQEMLQSPIVKKPIAIDNVIFNFYKLKGKTIFLPHKTSLYRFDPNGIFRGQKSIANHKKHFRHNWYLFYYLHKDPIQLIRSMGYAAKRFSIEFFK